MNQNQEKNSIRSFLDDISSRDQGVDCTGLTGSQQAYLIYRLYREIGQPVVVIAPSVDEAEKFMTDLMFFANDTDWPILSFPPYTILPFKYRSYHNEIAGQRLKALFQILESPSGRPPLVITTAGALIQKIIPRQVLSDFAELVMENEDTERDPLIQKLVSGGYKHCVLVEEPGDYSVRGGIIDIFSPLYENPLRIEFFGDTVDSLRFFSAETQRTLQRVSEAVILPARETILYPAELPDIISRIRTQASQMEVPVTHVRKIVDHLKNGGVFSGIETLMPIIYPRLDTFMDYVPENTLYVQLEPAKLEQFADEIHEQADFHYSVSKEQGILSVAACGHFLTWKEVSEKLSVKMPLSLKSILVEKSEDKTENQRVCHFRVDDNSDLVHELQSRKDTENVFNPLIKWIHEKQHLRITPFLVCATRSQGKRLESILQPYGVRTIITEKFQEKQISGTITGNSTDVFLCLGEISSGFVWPEASLAVLTETEIFGARQRRRKMSLSKTRSQFLNFDELQQGDLVVHAEHGIGRYEGLSKLQLDGSTGDFLQIQYQGEDKLYLPVDRMSMIQKYMGVDGILPALDKMGGKSWERVKERVKKTVEKIAGDLLKLYATRKIRKGHQFTDLSEEMREFEAAFPFEETPDQLSAIHEVFQDMISANPMDRLVCGDVGYGKTEVALRAAFLAVHDGKQVAILVPTTVLAEQHFNTFKDRFENYPVNLGCLSRFRSPKEQRAMIDGIRNGSIDIVIGTHRILQKDVSFKDLGLLVLDEEQRFGVKHKETLKRLKSTVDVLALTATPIPRTLHMSLVGVRDISVISTPPEYRKSIRTYVSEFDETMIREAVKKELKRKGQLFFVHNNIHSIEAVAGRLQALVPEVRLEIAHGRMNESELERVMLSFMNREIDMLVCTTIIESGLDIATANTIIINRADRFGLSQIYQLRGRVGRSEEQAYAYLFIPKETSLTRDAVKRLKVMMEHDDLGAGFQIAMSDLKIRGGGSILGASQSGHIAAVGYDMFLQLMETAMAEQKGEVVVEPLEPEINIPLSAFIPETYVPDIDQRLAAYRRLSRMSCIKEISDYKAELVDRFGALPQEANNLLIKIMLRIMAKKAGIKRLDLTDDQLVLYFSPLHQKNPSKLIEMVMARQQQYRLTPDNIFRAGLIKSKKVSPMAQAKNILKEISQHVNARN
jgi:transcription-repair coupling factor (superfamily II helicase)